MFLKYSEKIVGKASKRRNRKRKSTSRKNPNPSASRLSVSGYNYAPYQGNFLPVFQHFWVYGIEFFSFGMCLRPYHLEYTSSRPITEVKQG